MRDWDVVPDGLGRAVPFRVSGRTMWCSRTMWERLEGPKPDDTLMFESDGCSGGAPDVYRTWTGRRYKLWPACFIHDYHYRYPVLGDDAEARKLGDDVLRENIRRLVRLQGGGKWTAKRIAWLYWGRVRIWGASSWSHWGEGEEPLSFGARMREVWTR